ncbi:MAG: HAMP domain-containing histidine kinase [Candidatus Cloacimonetes bacterium]|nr:HAMP domain-containing histidine kinase [Candidatus Cloacimonadota bacterium]
MRAMLRSLRTRGAIKGLLFLLGVLLVISILLYAKSLVDDLKAQARREMSSRIEQYSLLVTFSADRVLDFIDTIDFPLVVTDAEGNPKFWKNIDWADSADSTSMRELKEFVVRMDQTGHEPIPVTYGGLTDYFHYGDSDLIRRVQIFPVVAILSIGFFGLLGYLGFRYVLTMEEGNIWVGMARETAHQLGTPISSLMGWIEVLELDPGMTDALEQMKLDTARLEKIAYRFSKIGSQVDLKPADVEAVIRKVVDYFSHRLPRGGRDVFLECEIEQPLPLVLLNAFLFEWVIENLIKNSLDSISATGGHIRLDARVVRQGTRLQIDVSDTGKGVDPARREEIFRPGVTSKSRGWGLGLSLARRIIQGYHSGRIFVHETRPGKGITFRILLNVPSSPVLPSSEPDKEREMT